MTDYVSLLSGKTVLVTGAAANIGRAIAVEMSRAGASVIAADIDQGKLADLKSELDTGGAEIHFLTVDVSNEESLSNLLVEIERFGLEVDVLVNNVGIHTDFDETRKGSFPNWRRTFDTNLIGPYHLTRSVVEKMKDRAEQGNIIFISSIHQWHIRGHPAYSASKAAIGMVVKELASEFAPLGIRVNGIAPGPVAPDEEVGLRGRLKVPLHGTAIPASYVGRGAVYLASDFFSRHTTGSIITIDSGMLARGFFLPQY
jgi:NAD(P)-dependent dehydrogenase (short-subunit alcohol dehydrogenase family)